MKLNAEALIQTASSIKNNIDHELLDAISKYNLSFSNSAKLTENLKALEKEDTLAVVSGQQTGLFLGPAFTLYKAASCIIATKKVEAICKRRCVPIFWLQTEDHDIEEINHCYTPVGDTTEKISYQSKSHPRTSIGQITLDKDIDLALSALENIFNNLPDELSVFPTLKLAYKNGQTLGDAFAQALSAIFSEEGLIVLNPLLPELKQQSKAIFRTALEKQEEIENLILTQTEKLSRSRSSTPVSIRENSPLFFLHLESASGPRYRIEKRNDRWAAIGTNSLIEPQELSNIIENSPERLSTSALLRPLVQDFLLPNICYLGGKTELDYLKQIEPLYELFKITQPLRAERAHLQILDIKTKRNLDKLGIQNKDLLLDEASLNTKLNRHNNDELSPEILHSELEKYLANAFEKLSAPYHALDQTLDKPLKKTKNNIDRSLQSLKNKYTKAYLAKQGINRERIQKTKSLLFPLGKEQERVISGVYFLARFGRAFRTNLLDSIETSNDEIIEILL